MNRWFFYAISALALCGCAENLPRNMPLVFAEGITVGISVGATTAEQGAEFSFGVRTKDVAIVPVVTYGDKSEKPELIKSKISKRTETETPGSGTVKVSSRSIVDEPNEDAYSVFGQFSTQTDGSARRVGLGKFFATGMAAVRIAEGFAHCMTNGACTSEDGKPAATQASGDGKSLQKATAAAPDRASAGMVQTSSR